MMKGAVKKGTKFATYNTSGASAATVSHGENGGVQLKYDVAPVSIVNSRSRESLGEAHAKNWHSLVRHGEGRDGVDEEPNVGGDTASEKMGGDVDDFLSIDGPVYEEEVEVCAWSP